MPKFYKNMKGGVARYLSETLKYGYEELLCLEEELQLVRHTAQRHVEQYSAAFELYESNKDNATVRELLKSSEDSMFAAFERVCEISKYAAKFSPASRDKEMQLVSDLIGSFIDTLYNICGNDNQGIAERFEVEIGRKLSIATNMGTNLTPDQTVIDMDNTIPEITSNGQEFNSVLVEAY